MAEYGMRFVLSALSPEATNTLKSEIGPEHGNLNAI
jgi:hypothetical protein